jgi:hypothetical protein
MPDKYKRVLDVWVELYPPPVKWSPTVWRQNMGQLKRMYYDKGYETQDVIDAIQYCKLRNKNVYSLGYLGFVIEEAKVYMQHRREQDEAERIRVQMESQTMPSIPQSNTPYEFGWLKTDDNEEVE